MSLGHILTVFSVLVAIISFAYNSNHKIIFYKFSRCDIYKGGAVLVLVSCLLMFDWMQGLELVIPCLFFESEKFPKPEQWAYIITVATLACIVYKSFYSKSIPQERQRELIVYYSELIESNISLLISYIKEYHQKDLLSYLKELDKGLKTERKSREQEEVPIFGDSQNKDEEEQPCRNLSALIFSEIILKPSFITESISHHYPSFFLEIVKDLTSPDVVGYKEAVETYYRTLLQSRDRNLTEAINGTENFLNDDSIRYRITDYRLSELIFENLDFTYNLEVCRSFGEEGMRSAKIDSIFAKTTDEWLDEEYRKTSARLCISFYDIFIREIIGREYAGTTSDNRLYIYTYYLYHICNEALENVGEGKYEGLYVEKLIEDTKSVIYNLLICIVKKGDTRFLSELLRVINSLLEISALPENEKVVLAKWYMETFMEFAHHCQNNTTTEFFFQCLKSCEGKPYKQYFIQSWNSTDYHNDGVDHAKYTSYSRYDNLKNYLQL